MCFSLSLCCSFVHPLLTVMCVHFCAQWLLLFARSNAYRMHESHDQMCCCTQVLSFGSCDTEIAFLPEAMIPKDFESMIEEKSAEEAAKSMAEVGGFTTVFIAPVTVTQIDSGLNEGSVLVQIQTNTASQPAPLHQGQRGGASTSAAVDGASSQPQQRAPQPQQSSSECFFLTPLGHQG